MPFFSADEKRGTLSRTSDGISVAKSEVHHDEKERKIKSEREGRKEKERKREERERRDEGFPLVR